MSSVRRRLAATFAATTLLALSACGFEAQTNQQYQAAVGANLFGEVDVLNAVAVANDDGSATISAGFVNNTGAEQALSSISATTLTGEELPVRGLRMLLPLPKDQLASVGLASDSGGFRITEGVKPGYYVTLTFSFSDAAPVTIETPVVARTADYNKVPGSAPVTADAATEEAAEEAAH